MMRIMKAEHYQRRWLTENSASSVELYEYKFMQHIERCVPYVRESMAVNGTSELDQVHQEQHLTDWRSGRHLDRT